MRFSCRQSYGVVNSSGISICRSSGRLTHFSTGPCLLGGLRAMGRGRQKAKHTKVARELKYNIPETDYEQLERELAGQRANKEDDELSKWSEYLDDEEDDTDDYGSYNERRFA